MPEPVSGTGQDHNPIPNPKGPMMFTLEIQTDNAAFQPDPALELSTLLRRVADKISQGDTSGRVRDANGNGVGYWTIEPSPFTFQDPE